MNTIATPVDLGVIEKLREEELEEARSIQSGMLPVEPLWAGGVRILTSFSPSRKWAAIFSTISR